MVSLAIVIEEKRDPDLSLWQPQIEVVSVTFL